MRHWRRKERVAGITHSCSMAEVSVNLQAMPPKPDLLVLAPLPDYSDRSVAG